MSSTLDPRAATMAAPASGDPPLAATLAEEAPVVTMGPELGLVVTREHAGRYRGPRQPDASAAPYPIEIGRGGIGRVLIAHDAHLGREVALKELLPQPKQPGSQHSTDPRSSLQAARFLREARLTGQLEHPNIVPVYELGRRDDGTLYYSMKVVRGRNLQVAMEAATSLAERMKLLGHFADLCDAIAYAHSRGVLHRDIKPENVMVGEFGETVVLDWGLAKPRDEGEPEAALADGADGRRPSQARPVSASVDEEGKIAATHDGSLLGTPLYMSPEQAQGELAQVDERSDVWALGVVLYELLTGTPPFTARTAVDLLVRIVRTDIEPVLKRCPEAPPELAAIAEKALQKDRSQRYPDARAMTEEIRSYLTGGRVTAFNYGAWRLLKRWAARHKAVLVTAAAAALALIALGVYSFISISQQRDEAMAARQVAVAAQEQAEAEARRAEEAELATRKSRDGAENLVRYIVSDLKERMEPMGQLALLDGVGRAIRDYYRATSQGRDAPRDPQRDRNRAAVMSLMGDIHRTRGDLSAAAESYRRAETLRTRLLEGAPDDPALRLDRSESHRQAGLLLQTQGDLLDARAQLDQARTLRAALAASDPTDADYARALIEIDLDLGELAALTGDMAGAKASFEVGTEAARVLVARHPDDDRARFELSLALEALGTAYFDTSNMGAARPAFDEARALREALIQRYPGNLDWVFRVAVAQARLAEVDLRELRLDGARAALDEAIAITSRLLNQDPTQVRWTRELVRALTLRSGMDLDQQRYEAALEGLQRGRDLLTTLLRRDEDNTELQRKLEVLHRELAGVLLSLGRRTEALDSYDEALTLTENLVLSDMANVGLRQHLGLSLVRMAEEHLAAQAPSEAVALLRRAVMVLEDVWAERPSDEALSGQVESTRRRLAELSDEP